MIKALTEIRGSFRQNRVRTWPGLCVRIPAQLCRVVAGVGLVQVDVLPLCAPNVKIFVVSGSGHKHVSLPSGPVQG